MTMTININIDHIYEINNADVYQFYYTTRMELKPTVGAENMFPIRSKLRWKTLFEVRRYFV